MESDDPLDESDSTDDIILVPENDVDADALKEFFSGLDDVGDELREHHVVRKHVRVESRLPMLCSTYFPMMAIADCLMIVTVWTLVFVELHNSRVDDRVVVPSWRFAHEPIDRAGWHLIFSIGFDHESFDHPPDEPLCFYAGERVPINDMFLQIAQRDWRLYRDLGVNPVDITIVICADHRCPHGTVVEAIRLAQEAGFRKFALRVRIGPDDTGD